MRSDFYHHFHNVLILVIIDRLDKRYDKATQHRAVHQQNVQLDFGNFYFENGNFK